MVLRVRGNINSSKYCPNCSALSKIFVCGSCLDSMNVSQLSDGKLKFKESKHEAYFPSQRVNQTRLRAGAYYSLDSGILENETQVCIFL